MQIDNGAGTAGAGTAGVPSKLGPRTSRPHHRDRGRLVRTTGTADVPSAPPGPRTSRPHHRDRGRPVRAGTADVPSELGPRTSRPHPHVPSASRNGPRFEQKTSPPREAGGLSL